MKGLFCVLVSLLFHAALFSAFSSLSPTPTALPTPKKTLQVSMQIQHQSPPPAAIKPVPAARKLLPKRQKQEVTPKKKVVASKKHPVKKAIADTPKRPPSVKPDRQESHQQKPQYVRRADYLRNPLPSYPLEARRKGLEGTVVLLVLVMEDGSSGRIQIHKSSGHKRLDDAALETVRSWKFSPYTVSGVKQQAQVLIPIRFTLQS